MTVFSTLKHSLICVLTVTIGYVRPIMAETLEVLKVYDQNNKNHEVEVIIKFKVLKENNQLKSLEKDDIAIESNGKTVEEFNFLRPDETTPQPSKIVILLDMSGSMKDTDTSGQVKGLAALQAIRSFSNYIKTKNYPSKINITPFATKGNGCDGNAYVPDTVGNNALSKFYAPETPELNIQLKNLENIFKGDESKRPCGGTDIRTPVRNTIEYLKTPYLSAEKDSTESDTRLGIILLSDGSDLKLSQSKNKENGELKKLETLLKNNSTITLHTLGYGKTDIDKDVLRRLALASGGINLFSANALEINRALETFLISLTGGYEVRYQPSSIKQYQPEEIEIKVAGLSENEKHRINNIPSLPVETRFFIFLVALVFCGFFGVLPFFVWRWLLTLPR